MFKTLYELTPQLLNLESYRKDYVVSTEEFRELIGSSKDLQFTSRLNDLLVIFLRI